MMRLRDPKLWLAAISLVLVTCLVVIDLDRTSPGPLSATHAAVSGLEERDCTSCHASGAGDAAAACGACHTRITDQIAGRFGFHGALQAARDCGQCHAEHLGADHELVGSRAFRLAGFPSRDDYAHDGLAFALHGKHEELQCSACHPLADAAVLAEGERRFLGANQDCAACHEDPHDGRMVKSCEACHGQSEPFADLDAFVHTADFPLAGVHAVDACSDCHAPNSAYAVEALGGLDAPAARECASCHEQPHTDPFIRSVAALLEVTSGATCVSCHALDRPSFESANLIHTARLHAASGFPLQVPHEGIDCAACHDPAVLAGSGTQRFADDCAACHASPHDDQFDQGAFAGSNCLECHQRNSFQPSTIDAQMHARTSFPLTAGHARPTCVECHSVRADAPLGTAVFASAPTDCAACHADAHDGHFDALAVENAFTADCGACHATTHFADLDPNAFDHAAWTNFALDGAHAQAACEACHQRAHEPDRFGRQFGRVAELFGRPTTACATCHVNVHVGTMAQRSTSCADCHDTMQFGSVDRASFDHAAHTGFALVEAHARLSCERCHAPRSLPDADRRTFGIAEETFGRAIENCADCHADVHAGRFDGPAMPREVNGSISCARCHDQTHFGDAVRTGFDHGLWTGYALEGAHASASCTACHASTDTAPRYAPQSTACSACHTDSHAGQFGRSEGKACERCHTSTVSFAELTFDHQVDSRFALDATHEALACSACHQAWPLAGGGEAVRYKPLGVECADCHLGGSPR